MFFALVAAASAGSSCYSALPGPLNIAQPIVGETNQLHLAYPASSPWVVQPSANNLALVAQGGASQLTYGGETFTAQYAELKSPAEHTLGPHRQVYPAELQLFHTAPSGKVLALSVLFKRGAARSALFDDVLGALGGKPAAVNVEMPSLLQTDGGYFAYATPRCNADRKLGEADQWVLLSKMSEVSPEQLQQLTQTLPHLGESSRASVDAHGITISSSLMQAPAPPAPPAPAAPPALAAPAAPAMPAPPAAFMQGGMGAGSMMSAQALQAQQMNAVLSAYPTEQREQLVKQYQTWYDTYERYLQQVQTNQATAQQALAYEQQVSDYNHAQDASKMANVISGGIPLALMQASSRTTSSTAVQVQELARREAAVAAREMAVTVREQQVSTELASLAALELNKGAGAATATLASATASSTASSAASTAQRRSSLRKPLPEKPAPLPVEKVQETPPAAAPAKVAEAPTTKPAKVEQKGAAPKASFAQVAATTEVKSQTQTQRAGTIGGGASDLHFLAAANLPADAGDHEDAVTVAAVGGEGAEDEDAAQKATVEDAASTSAADAAGENADNDNIESILLQKGAKTKRVRAASQ